MPNAENLIPYQFKKGQSGNPKGRPKSRVGSTLLKVMPRRRVNRFYGMTVEELKEWESALLTMQIDELSNLAKENEAPVYVRGLAMTILMESKNGQSKALERLREHVFGKALQRMELTGADGQALIAERNLTASDVADIMQEYDARFKQGAAIGYEVPHTSTADTDTNTHE